MRQPRGAERAKPMKQALSCRGYLWSWQIAERIGFAGIDGAGARFSPRSEFEAIAFKALIGGGCHE